MANSGVCRVFVRNLDINVNNQTLIDIFSRFGRVLTANVVHYRTGSGKAFGNVIFLSQNEANNAIIHANGLLIGTRYITVEKHIKKKMRKQLFRKILIRNVSQTVATEEQMFNWMSSFGTVCEVEIIRDNNRQFTGSAFVTFADQKSADNAIRCTNGSYSLPDRPLIAERAPHQSQRPG